jgi:hypothetical protein
MSRSLDMCPACGRRVVWVDCDGHLVPCEPQRRLFIFDGPYDDNGLPVEGITGFDEATGRMIIGRAATKKESKAFAKSKRTGKPFTIGLVGHWSTGDCPMLSEYLQGEVSVPERTNER